MFKYISIILLSISTFPSCAQQQEPSTSLRKSIPELPLISLKDSGFNSDSIAKLVSDINDTPPNDFRGVVVIKNNKIVIEEYFNTFWRNTIHDIRSAGKSITSLLLGIAMQEGLVQNLDQSVYSFFPKSKYPSINEDYKKIQLRHLLNMSSGLDADTDRPQTAGHVVKWIAKDDWMEYLLQVPLNNQPGKNWVYADINAVLIGSVIEETSGMSLRDFAQQKLFDPLGIKQFYWYTNAANQTGGAGNLYLSTLDFAKLGILITNQGKWKEKQIIDPNFIKELFNERVPLPDDYAPTDAYGLLWYKSQRTINGKKFDYLYASGNGGNHLVVIPDYEIVIALTSSAYGQRYAHRRSRIIMRRILESLE